MSGGIHSAFSKKARRAVGSHFLPHETLIDQRRQPVQRIYRQIARYTLGGATHRRDGFKRAAAREHTQPPEQRLLAHIQQLITPLDGVPQGLLAGGQVARTSR